MSDLTKYAPCAKTNLITRVQYEKVVDYFSDREVRELLVMTTPGNAIFREEAQRLTLQQKSGMRIGAEYFENDWDVYDRLTPQLPKDVADRFNYCDILIGADVLIDKVKESYTNSALWLDIDGVTGWRTWLESSPGILLYLSRMLRDLHGKTGNLIFSFTSAMRTGRRGGPPGHRNIQNDLDTFLAMHNLKTERIWHTGFDRFDTTGCPILRRARDKKQFSYDENNQTIDPRGKGHMYRNLYVIKEL